MRIRLSEHPLLQPGAMKYLENRSGLLLSLAAQLTETKASQDAALYSRRGATTKPWEMLGLDKQESK